MGTWRSRLTGLTAVRGCRFRLHFFMAIAHTNKGRVSNRGNRLEGVCRGLQSGGRIAVGNHFFFLERLDKRMRRREHQLNLRPAGRHRLEFSLHVGQQFWIWRSCAKASGSSVVSATSVGCAIRVPARSASAAGLAIGAAASCGDGRQFQGAVIEAHKLDQSLAGRRCSRAAGSRELLQVVRLALRRAPVQSARCRPRKPRATRGRRPG